MYSISDSTSFLTKLFRRHLATVSSPEAIDLEEERKSRRYKPSLLYDFLTFGEASDFETTNIFLAG